MNPTFWTDHALKRLRQRFGAKDPECLAYNAKRASNRQRRHIKATGRDSIFYVSGDTVLVVNKFTGGIVTVLKMEKRRERH